MSIIIAFVLVFIFFSAFGFKILNQDETGVHLRLGRIIGVIKPGLCIICPAIDKIIKYKISPQDLKITDIEYLDSFRKADKLSVIINYQIISPEDTFKNILDVNQSLKDLVSSTTKQLLLNHSKSELSSSVNKIESELKNKISDACKNWGIQLNQTNLVLK